GHPGMIQRLQQPGEIGRLTARQVQRVDADTAPDIVVLLRQRLDHRRIGRVYPDAEEFADTPCTGGIERVVEGAVVGGEVKAVEMAVGIYQHDHMVWVGRSDLSAPAR